MRWLPVWLARWLRRNDLPRIVIQIEGPLARRLDGDL